MSELVISYAKLCHTYVFYPARMQSARPTIVCPRIATLALVLRCSRTYKYLRLLLQLCTALRLPADLSQISAKK